MRVVVVGAGYAGAIAANRLAKKLPKAEITVVNPRADFIERVRLHQQTAGTGKASTPLAKMLRKGIEIRVGSVEKVGNDAVVLDGGEQLGFDYAVIATGSTVTPLPGTVPVGVWEGAERARDLVAGLASDSTVTVIGGGLTGIETAAEIAYSRNDLHVRLVANELAPSLSEKARRRVRKTLAKIGVEIVDGVVAAVEQRVDDSVVRLQSGIELASDLNLWAVISGVPGLVGQSGLEVDELGRGVVDEFLRSISSPNIFVVGDCAAVPGARPACATATPQGAHTADNLARIAKGKDPKPYSMGYVGQCISLGRRNGVLQFVGADDSPRDLYISGFSAAIAKETINRYAKFGSQTATYVWKKGSK